MSWGERCSYPETQHFYTLEKPLYVLKETDIKNYKGLKINEKQISQAMLIKQYYVLVKINEEIPHLPMWLNLPNNNE